MKKYCIFIFLLGLSASVFSQSLNLQPAADEGRDAIIHGLQSETNVNYGDNPQFVTAAWTFNGEPGIVRSILSFDVSPIPVNAIIVSAKLSLFAWDFSSGMGQHSSLSGPNDFWIERITSEWNESTVTWNTQPTTTELNRVGLSESTSPDQDYLEIDISLLVQEMVANPANNFGFMIKLKDENYYRRINFCSSDHPVDKFHPKLEIVYSLTNEVSEQHDDTSTLTIHPNPANETIMINNGKEAIGKNYVITNQIGQIMIQNKITSGDFTIDISNFSAGIYFFKVEEGKTIRIEKT